MQFVSLASNNLNLHKGWYIKAMYACWNKMTFIACDIASGQKVWDRDSEYEV